MKTRMLSSGDTATMKTRLSNSGHTATMKTSMSKSGHTATMKTSMLSSGDTATMKTSMLSSSDTATMNNMQALAKSNQRDSILLSRPRPPAKSQVERGALRELRRFLVEKSLELCLQRIQIRPGLLLL